MHFSGIDTYPDIDYSSSTFDLTVTFGVDCSVVTPALVDSKMSTSLYTRLDFVIAA